jgi:hypothetical protein
MSDDLVKRLREGATWDDDIAAANRIEELEAKLAKAVEALVNTRLVLAEYEPHPLPVLGKVQATLAELKGGIGDE